MHAMDLVAVFCYLQLIFKWFSKITGTFKRETEYKANGVKYKQLENR